MFPKLRGILSALSYHTMGILTSLQIDILIVHKYEHDIFKEIKLRNQVPNWIFQKYMRFVLTEIMSYSLILGILQSLMFPDLSIFHRPKTRSYCNL